MDNAFYSAVRPFCPFDFLLSFQLCRPVTHDRERKGLRARNRRLNEKALPVGCCFKSVAVNVPAR